MHCIELNLFYPSCAYAISSNAEKVIWKNFLRSFPLKWQVHATTSVKFC